MSEDAKKNRRSGWKTIAIAVGGLLVMAAVAFGYWYLYMRGLVTSDDARIDGDMVDLAPRISGTLVQVAPGEGDRVAEGDLLFSLDTRELEAALARAEAQVEAGRAALQVAQAQQLKAQHGPRTAEIEIARAALARAEAQLKLAETDRSRARRLFEQQAVARSRLDQAQTAWEAAEQARRAAADRLRLLQQGTRSEDLSAAQATLERLRAQLAVAEAGASQVRIQLEQARVSAPFDGVVVRRWRDPGGMIAAGTPVLTLLDPSSLRVSANIDERDLSRIAIGDPVDISVDAYPDLHLSGEVDKILRATNSQFSLVPAEGVSGTFIKVAQRVPIRVSLALPDDLPLGPGLSVEISVHVGREAGP